MFWTFWAASLLLPFFFTVHCFPIEPFSVGVAVFVMLLKSFCKLMIA